MPVPANTKARPLVTADSPRTPATTVSDVTGKRTIGHLITHIGKNDPHLYTALNSLQGQSNDLVSNIEDLVAAINKLSNSVNDGFIKLAAQIDKAIKVSTGVTTTTIKKPDSIIPPAMPGGGGIRGFVVNSGGAAGNTKPIPKKVSA